MIITKPKHIVTKVQLSMTDEEEACLKKAYAILSNVEEELCDSMEEPEGVLEFVDARDKTMYSAPSISVEQAIDAKSIINALIEMRHAEHGVQITYFE